MKKLLASVLLVAGAAFCDWTSTDQIPAHVSVETPCKKVNNVDVPDFSDKIAFIQVPGVSSYNIGVSLSKDGTRFEDVLEAAKYARRNSKGLGFFLGNISGDNVGGQRTVTILSGTGTCSESRTYFVAYGTKD